MSNLDRIKNGYWSVATQKHLKVFRNETTGLGQLGNLNTSGKVGRLLGAIRGNNQITNLLKLESMANNVGIQSKAELIMMILPILEKASDGRIELIRDKVGEVTGIAEYMFENTHVLEIAGQVFENLHPTDIERVVVSTMDETKKIPYLKSELMDMLMKIGYNEQNINLSLALQSNFNLIQILNKTKSLEPIISNEYVWGLNHEKIAMAVSTLEIGQRENLKDIIEMIQGSQGFPLEELSKESNSILQLAKKVGMINPVKILSTRGFDKEFGFSANLMQHDIYNDDILDDVKLFLASIRFGENYTLISRINDAKDFLNSLIRNGNIGPHIANSTDYTMLEKSGIVRVVTKTKPSYYGGTRTGPCLELLRKDVAEEALKIISSPDYKINVDLDITDFGSLMDVGSSITPEEMRIFMGQSTESSQVIEDHALRMLRGELY